LILEMMYFGINDDLFSFYIQLMHKLHTHDFSVIFGLIQEWINFTVCSLVLAQFVKIIPWSTEIFGWIRSNTLIKSGFQF